MHEVHITGNLAVIHDDDDGTKASAAPCENNNGTSASPAPCESTAPQFVSAQEIAAATLKVSPFTPEGPVCMVERLRKLGESVNRLQARRRTVTDKILGNAADEYSTPVPEEASIGQWLEIITAVLDVECRNLETLSESL